MPYVLIGILMLLISSCGSSDNNPTSENSRSIAVKLTPPTRLINNPIIDLNSLFAELIVSYDITADDEIEPFTAPSQTAVREGDTNSWLASIDVPDNTVFSITITWYDIVDDPQKVELATITRTLMSGSANATIQLNYPSTEYDSSVFDLDGDTVSNLDEREDGSDPLVANITQDEPPVSVAPQDNPLQPDSDGDGVIDSQDNCVSAPNPGQDNIDGDALGDACDDDDDNDLTVDSEDCSPNDDQVHPSATEIADGKVNNCDGVVDNASIDTDLDGVADELDNCPTIANVEQENVDSDELGDICDQDDDNDGSADVVDCEDKDADIFPGAIETQDNKDNNCDGLVDNIPGQSKGLISAVSIGDIKGEFYTGAPPQPAGSITLDPLTETGVEPVTIISGGSLEIEISADTPFSSIYILTGTDGYFHVLLPAAVMAATATVTFSTEQLHQGSAQLDVIVESSMGDVSNIQELALTTLVVGTGELQISVSWDTATDIDLQLLEPNGEIINFENLISTNGGMLDLDSNPGCDIDGVNNENVNYETGEPPPGEYVVFLTYFSDCGVEENTNFVVTTRVNGLINTFSGVLTPADVLFSAGNAFDLEKYVVTRIEYPAASAQ